MWTLDLPLIQPSSPAALVAATLQRTLGDKISDYTYVDFCAGAGGPTPYIERDLNTRLGLSKPISNGLGKETSGASVDFVLTDIAPHLPAWEAASKKSDNLHYIPTSVDAADAPRDLLKPFQKKESTFRPSSKVFRLFFLAFHHFDDPLAAKILANSLDTADGFGIFELQNRTFSSLLTCTLMWPLLLLVSPFYFWRDPGHLFFTYVVPVIPFVLVVDGYTSSLRTRAPDEIKSMMRRQDIEGWKFGNGSEYHTYPIGEMSWFMGVRK